MASIQDIVFDSPHPAPIARFWADALGGYQVAPYDEAELARLRAKGIFDVEDDPVVVVEPDPAGDRAGGPRLIFQQVPEPRTVKNRVHLDLSATDPAAEIERLTGLGARVLAVREHWTTLADPDGNELCVMHS
jgi:hypothetical protein